jgi:hypothetical protein
MVIYDKNQLTFNVVFVMILLVSILLNVYYATNLNKLDETFSEISKNLSVIEQNQNFNFIQGPHIDIDYALTEHGFLIRSSDDFGLFNGPSMQPVIFDQNVVIQKKISSDYVIKEGDIVRFKRPNGQGVVHRVRANYGDTLYIQGDSDKTGEIIDKSQVSHIILGVIYT